MTIYARTTSKLPPDTATNPKVHIVQGEFTDLEATKEALSYGAQVLVSFAGPSVPNKGTPVSEFYRTILFPLVATEGKIKRALITSTASYSAPGDTFSLKFWFGTTMLKWLAGSAYYEINGMSKAVIDLLPVDEVAWTMFR